MTDRHSIIFYLLFGAVISNIIASITSRKSFYDAIKESYLKEVDEMVERPRVKNWLKIESKNFYLLTNDVET